MPHTFVDVPADRLDDPRVLMLRLQEILFGQIAFLYEPQEMGPVGRMFWSLDPRCRCAGVIRDGRLLIQFNDPLDHWAEEDMPALARVLPKLLVVPGSVRSGTSSSADE